MRWLCEATLAVLVFRASWGWSVQRMVRSNLNISGYQPQRTRLRPKQSLPARFDHKRWLVRPNLLSPAYPLAHQRIPAILPAYPDTPAVLVAYSDTDAGCCLLEARAATTAWSSPCYFQRPLIRPHRTAAAHAAPARWRRWRSGHRARPWRPGRPPRCGSPAGAARWTRR